jgi:hypothetical protein
MSYKLILNAQLSRLESICPETGGIFLPGDSVDKNTLCISLPEDSVDKNTLCISLPGNFVEENSMKFRIKNFQSA